MVPRSNPAEQVALGEGQAKAKALVWRNGRAVGGRERNPAELLQLQEVSAPAPPPMSVLLNELDRS